MKVYAKEFKEKIIAKALTTGSKKVKQLARDLGIPYQTLYSWVAMKRKEADTNKKPVTEGAPAVRPQNWSVEAKLKALKETAFMDEKALGEYCRRHGLYTHYLEEWNQLCLEGMKPTANKLTKVEIQQLEAKNKQLEKELRRKEKALAEASALLILKKKAELLWGEAPDD